jgi:multidrug resistance efflux pump
MILIILLSWMGLLQLLVTVGVFKGWAKWMKLSPIAIWAAANVAFIIPMNFGAPQGPAIAVRSYLPIVPQVSGPVSAVLATSGEPVREGDILFTIDDGIYRNSLDKTDAKLRLAEQRLQQAEELFDGGIGREADIQTYSSEVDALSAQRNIDQFNLNNTKVFAPADGVVPSVTLQKGSQLTAYGQPAMSFVKDGEGAIGVQIKQSHIRNVRVGDKAEVIFKARPGDVFAGKVIKIMTASSQALVAPSGKGFEYFAIDDEPVWVTVQLDEGNDNIYPGAIGTVAIYTNKFAVSRLFRKITLRMSNWMNYLM